MSKTKTFVDANVLIWAARGDHDLSEAALEILDDPGREFIASDMLCLEVLPKAIYNKKVTEARFYRTFFDDPATTILTTSAASVAAAQTEAETNGLSAIDALHIATAKLEKAEEFITGEKSTKPLFRTPDIKVTSIWPTQT